MPNELQPIIAAHHSSINHPRLILSAMTDAAHHSSINHPRLKLSAMTDAALIHRSTTRALSAMTDAALIHGSTTRVLSAMTDAAHHSSIHHPHRVSHDRGRLLVGRCSWHSSCQPLSQVQIRQATRILRTCDCEKKMHGCCKRLTSCEHRCVSSATINDANLRDHKSWLQLAESQHSQVLELAQMTTPEDALLEDDEDCSSHCHGVYTPHKHVNVLAQVFPCAPTYP